MTSIDQFYEVVGSDVVGTISKLIKISVLNTNDTLTFPDITTVLAFQGYKASDMTTPITGTISGNVVTITTAALTNVTAVAIVTGVKNR